MVRKINPKFSIQFMSGLAILALVSGKATNAFAATSQKDRIYGNNRYSTAVEISKEGWASSDYAVIVRGDDFADALCSVPLAELYKAPILLTDKNVLNDEVIDELKRLEVKNVFIAGGTGAISSNVEDSIKTLGISVERISGSNRYETSINIANKLGVNGKIVLSTGNNFADALSIAPVASKEQMPIILTDKDNLPQVVDEYIKENNITTTYIIGGSGVISDSIEKSISNAERIAGNDRYETNAAVMERFKDILNFENLYVAVGNDFADALAGAPLGAKMSSPIVLVHKTLSTSIGNFVQTETTPKTNIVALGGETVVSNSIVTSIKDLNKITYESDDSVIGGSNVNNIESIKNNVDIQGNGTMFKNANVEGNVYVYGANSNLENVTANTIFIDPGENGTVTLKNVTAAKVKVLSGAQNSIHLIDVNTDVLSVESKNEVENNVRVVTEGTTAIGTTLVKSNAILDAASGSFGNVGILNINIKEKDGNPKSVELRGNFDKTLLVKGNININADTDAMISKIVLSEDKADNILLNGSGIIQDVEIKNKTANINIDKNINLQGQIKHVDGAKVNVDANFNDKLVKADIKDLDKTEVDTQGKDKGTPPKVDGIASLNDGKEYVGNINLTQPGTYGPTQGQVKIKGELYLKADGINLNNVDVDTLVIDPGDNASVHLSNIHAKDIKVLSGGYNSIHFDGVTSDNLVVENDSTVRIVAGQGTSVKVTDIKSGGRLETDGDSNLGTVNVKPVENLSSGLIEFKGNFNDINIKSSVSVSLNEGVKASNVTVSELAQDAKLNLCSGASVSQINVNAKASLDIGEEVNVAEAVNMNAKDIEVNVGSSANIGVVFVSEKAENAKLQVSGTNAAINTISVNAKADIKVGSGAKIENAVVADKALGSSIQINEKASVKALEVKADNFNLSGNGTVEQVKADKGKIKIVGLVLDGDEENGYKAEVSDSIGLTYALNNDKVKEILLNDGVYKIFEKTLNRDLSITGKSEKAIITSSSAVFFNIINDKTLTMKNVELQGIEKNAYGAYINSSGKMLCENVKYDKNMEVSYKDIENLINFLDNTNNIDENTLKNAVAVVNILLENEQGADLISKFNTKAKSIYVSFVNNKIEEASNLSNITFENLPKVKDKIREIENILISLKEIGMNYADFNYDKVKIANEKIGLIDKINKELDSITSLNNINSSNLNSMNEKLKSIDELIKIAKSDKYAAADSDFKNLDNFKKAFEKAEAIKNVNSKLKLIKAIDKVTNESKEKLMSMVQDIDKDVSDAKDKGADISDFIGFDRFQVLKYKIDNFEVNNNEKNKIIEEVKKYFGEIPSEDKIDISNAASLYYKVKIIENKINEAKSKGAGEKDFADILEVINKIEYRIKSFITNKEDALNLTNNFITNALQDEKITSYNVEEMQAKVNIALEIASFVKNKYGFLDSDFKDITKLNEMQNKINEIVKNNKQKEFLIQIANEKINKIMPSSYITLDNKEEAKTQIEDAMSAVKAAKEKGAQDYEFNAIGRIYEINNRLFFLEKFAEEKAKIIAQIDEMTNSIPITINYDNLLEAKAKLIMTEMKVKDAISKGIYENEIKSLNKMEEIRVTIEGVEKLLSSEQSNSLVMAAVEKIPQNISFENLDEVQMINRLIEEVMNLSKQKSNIEYDNSIFQKVFDLKQKVNSLMLIQNEKINKIRMANDALMQLPLEYVSAWNIDAVEQKIAFAEKMVSQAKGGPFNAQDCDFVGLERLTKIKDIIQKVLKEKETVLVEAKNAINAVPLVKDVNQDNINETMEKVKFAYNAIQKAKDFGASIGENGDISLEDINKLKAIEQLACNNNDSKDLMKFNVWTEGRQEDNLIKINFEALSKGDIIKIFKGSDESIQIGKDFVVDKEEGRFIIDKFDMGEELSVKVQVIRGDQKFDKREISIPINMDIRKGTDKGNKIIIQSIKPNDVIKIYDVDNDNIVIAESKPVEEGKCDVVFDNLEFSNKKAIKVQLIRGDKATYKMYVNLEELLGFDVGGVKGSGNTAIIEVFGAVKDDVIRIFGGDGSEITGFTPVFKEDKNIRYAEICGINGDILKDLKVQLIRGDVASKVKNLNLVDKLIFTSNAEEISKENIEFKVEDDVNNEMTKKLIVRLKDNSMNVNAGFSDTVTMNVCSPYVEFKDIILKENGDNSGEFTSTITISKDVNVPEVSKLDGIIVLNLGSNEINNK